MIEFDYDGKAIGTATITTHKNTMAKLSNTKFHHELSILNPGLFTNGTSSGDSFRSLSNMVENNLHRGDILTHKEWKSLNNKTRSKVISKSFVGDSYDFTHKDWFNHLESLKKPEDFSLEMLNKLIHPAPDKI